MRRETETRIRVFGEGDHDPLTAAIADALAPGRLEALPIEEAARRTMVAVREVLVRRGVAAEKIGPPSAEVLGAALHMLRFPHLAAVVRDLYVGLVATAMERAPRVEAHPAFADIIRQLSPGEARVLSLLLAGGGIVSHPLLDSCLSTGDQAPVPLCRHLTLAGDLIGMTSLIEPDHLDNLVRLGVIEVRYQMAFDDVVYDDIRHDVRVMAALDRAKAASQALGATGEIHLTPGVFRATQFGAAFVHCCLG